VPQRHASAAPRSLQRSVACRRSMSSMPRFPPPAPSLPRCSRGAAYSSATAAKPHQAEENAGRRRRPLRFLPVERRSRVGRRLTARAASPRHFSRQQQNTMPPPAPCAVRRRQSAGQRASRSNRPAAAHPSRYAQQRYPSVAAPQRASLPRRQRHRTNRETPSEE